MGRVYKLSNHVPCGELYLKPDSWKVLAQVDGASSLAEIARKAGVDELAAELIVDSLYEAGILEVVTAYVPRDLRTRRVTRAALAGNAPHLADGRSSS